MFDGQNDGGMMNKQTLFVKVSDTSGADMLSQNPYTQILTGGGGIGILTLLKSQD